MRKQKKCKVCKELFYPSLTTQKVCGYTCAALLVKEKNDKEFRKETIRLKKTLKTRADWLAAAQTACNAYIRSRDKDQPCISCGTQNPNIQYCAGHYLTRGGHPELRFNELNIHRQCNHHCNLRLSGNIREYRIKLIEKIGLSQVEWLEGKQVAQKWSIEEIQEIKKYYKDKLKELT